MMFISARRLRPEHARILFVLCLLPLIGISCPPRDGPVIGPNDTFMFTYIDRDGQIRTRWSQDGWRWEEADLQTSAIYDGGVGSAASVDNVGAMRWIAYPDTFGRLILHGGLGAAFDSGGTLASDVETHGAPAMTAISSGRWVVATLGGTLNQAAVFHAFQNPRTLTDVSPANPGAIRNERLLRPPQVISRGGVFVAAWMRWQMAGPARVPDDVRILRGTDAGGTVDWLGSAEFDVTEPGFGGALTDPALSHDGSDFLLGIIRRESGGGDERLFIYRSPDALNWSLAEQFEVPFGTGTTVRLAAHGSGKMFVGVNGTSSASFYRKWKGEWEPVRSANVWGTARPHWYPFSIIAAGRPRPAIYVDAGVSVSGNGTEASPYRTIQEAADSANRGDRIRVLANNGFYRENVTLPQGVMLEGWEGEALLSVTGFTPAIVAEGDNYIRAIRIENLDASAAIHVDLATALAGLEGDGSAAYLDVDDTWLSAGNFGVEVVADPGLAFGGDNERVFRPRVRHNRIVGHAIGVSVEIVGPSTGTLQIPIEAYDNLFDGNFTGIRLKIAGGAPNTGGFARATITGRIRNNLIIEGGNGVSFEAEDAGTILTPLYFNTLARNVQHNVVCSADPGPNGPSRVRSRLSCNIVADAGNFGYLEFTDGCDLAQFQNNLLFGNQVNYGDSEDLTPFNSEADMNSAITGGAGNRVADPLFVNGWYHWRNSMDSGPPGEFFLTQDAVATSPAVNLCLGTTVQDNGLTGFSTRTDYTADTDPPDTGYHYTP